MSTVFSGKVGTDLLDSLAEEIVVCNSVKTLLSYGVSFESSIY